MSAEQFFLPRVCNLYFDPKRDYINETMKYDYNKQFELELTGH